MPAGRLSRIIQQARTPELRDYGVGTKYAKEYSPSGQNPRDFMQQKAIGEAALRRSAKYKLISERFNKAMQAEPKQVNKALQAVTELTDDIVQTAMESDPTKPGAEPTVIGDVVAGLQELKRRDPVLLDMAFRRATLKKPSISDMPAETPDRALGALGENVLETAGDQTGAVDELRELVYGDVLAETPDTENPVIQQAQRTARADAERQQRGFTQQDIPLIARMSQVLNDPASTVKKKFDKYKVGDQVSLTQLMGDMAREIKKIEDRGGVPQLPPMEGQPKQLASAMFGQAVGLEPRRTRDDTIKAGTAQGTGFTGGSKKFSGRLKTALDTEIENRNRSTKDNLIRELMRVTSAPDTALSPKFVESPLTGTQQKIAKTDVFGGKSKKTGEDESIGSTQRGFALSDKQLEGWLDKNFPEWRGRFQVLDEQGQASYPELAPDAEFLSYLLASRYEIPNPKEFVERIKPFMQKAIDAAPEEAPKGSRKQLAQTGKAVRTPRGFDMTAFDMGPGAEKEMRAGGPSADNPNFPFPVYDSRLIPKKLVRADVQPHPSSRFAKKIEPLTAEDLPDMTEMNIDPEELNVSGEQLQSGTLESDDLPAAPPLDDIGSTQPMNKIRAMALNNLLS